MEALPMQQAALQQLAGVPGVVGSMVFDGQGQVVASEFPPVFEETGLRQLASQLAADAYFQEWLGGDPAALDLRFGDGTVVVRPVDGTWLLVLCTPQANSQLLSMSLTQVARRLKLSAAGVHGGRTGEHALPAVAAAVAPAPPSPVERLKAIVAAELGGQAAQALEILAAAGTSPQALQAAAADVEKLTRLFISRKKADEIGRKLRDAIGD